MSATSPHWNAALERRLRDALPGDALRTDAADRIAYGFDNSSYRGLPDAVLLPQDETQVQAIVQACRASRCPLIARGRGTNTTGASVALAGGLVIGFERMNRLLALDPASRVAVVEPGLLNGELQAAAGAEGLFWPPDPTSAPYSSIGGNLACNAGGPRTVKYGACRDNTLGLTAIAGSGERLRAGGPYTKLASGYDLTHLLVGSEGSLALITQAELRLLPKPPELAALRALYCDATAAAQAVARVMRQPVAPCALEFMDGECLRLARERGGADLPDAGALLMIEVDGEGAGLAAALAALERAAQGEGLLALERADDPSQREALWSARRALSPALRSVAPGKINEDVVVPVMRLPALVERLGLLSREHAIPILCFGHAGNGNLHVNLLYHPDDAAEAARTQTCLRAVFDLVLELGGMPSGEHGIGLAKRDFLQRALEPETLAIMRRIKAAFDPEGILNPGKLLGE
jgi:D-lactate dehydrogenase (quinone)